MLDGILNKALGGERLTFDEGVQLLRDGDLMQMGWAADRVRRRLHPENVVTFVIDRNINYTNVCISGCKFCAFYRGKDHREAYVLSKEEIFAKIEETIEGQGTQILMQGGLHPDLPLEFYEDLLRSLKERYPINLHCFSPPEIVHFSRVSGLSTGQVLERLVEAGLDSIPGGGAEILVDRVRQAISPHKATTGEWLDVMATAHRLGLPTTATMMYGTVETDAERVEHMEQIRRLQDETRGFTAFIPWSFQPQNTALSGGKTSVYTYLKILALSRLYLDNVPNIQVSWVTQGTKIAQIALSFGANDFGSTMLEENVVRAAGATYRTTLDEILSAIVDAGYNPAQRNTRYEILCTFS
ncbi:MAG: cyclic dehypoxanthinyl futalosine synthase [Bacillota bacterium]